MLNKLLPGLFYPIIVLLFCSLPYLLQGYPLGHDTVHGLIRVKEFHIALKNQQLPPFWAENLYGGYGSPVFLFYAPLYMLAATIFYLISGSFIGGNILAVIFFTVAGGLGVYYLVREMLGENTPITQSAARIASYCYLLNPYLVGDKFIRIANSEYTALCLAPIALYGLIKIKREPLKGSLYLGAGLALVILAHNLTALVILAMLVTLSPILYWKTSGRNVWLYVMSGIIMGLLLSIFFWFPALFYKSLVNIEQISLFNFHEHFQDVSKYFTTSNFLSLGFINAWIIIGCALLLWKTRTRKKTLAITLARANLTFVFLFIFLQTKLSLPLWENMPFLALFQFPWRMNGPLALVTSLLFGLLFPFYFTSTHYKSLKTVELIILFFCVINILPILSNDIMYSESTIHELISRFKTNEIKTIVLTSTEVDEYLPKSTKIKLKHYDKELAPLILGSRINANTTIIKDTGTEIILETNAPQSTQLELKRWFFPGWEYRVNGVEQHVEKSDSGLIAVNIPPGHHYIDIKLKPPFLRQLFTWVSFTALALWTILVIKSISRNSQPLKPENSVIY